MIPLVLFALAGCFAVNPDSDRITVSDLVPAWPEIAAIPAGTPISFAPAPGVSRVLQPFEIRRIAERFGIGMPLDAGLCFERRVAPIDRDRLLEAMQRSMPQARIELLDWSR